MRIFLLLFIVLASSQSYCQSFLSGFIVKINGDSSKVLIKEILPSQSSEKCIVKEDGQLIHYSPKDLSAYGYFGGNRFEALTINGRSFFVKVLVRGSLSLYQEGKTFYVKEKEILALSNAKSESNYYIKTLNSILEKCNLIATEISYSEKELTSIVQNYNRCEGEAGATFKQRLPKTMVNFHLKSGYAKNTLSAVSQNYESTSTSNSVPVGVGVEFSLPRVFRKLFVTTELVFEKNQYQFYHESLKYSTVTRRDTYVEFTSLKIPMGLKYHLFSLNNTPFVSTGISPTVFLSKTQNIIDEKESGSVITTSSSNGQTDVSQSGFWFGIGYTHSLYQKTNFSMEARYEKFTGSMGSDVNYNTHGNSVSITIGVRY